MAPAGYGKTVAAAQFAASIPRGRCGWLRLDESDASADRLLFHIIGTLHESLPELSGCGILARAEEGPEWKLLLDELCFSIQEFVKSNCWLILDNWEYVGSDVAAQQMLTDLILNTPPLLGVVITGRKFTGRSLKALERQGQARVIGPDTLRFSPDEVAELARTRGGTPLSPEQTGEVWERSGGWCVSAAMLLSGRLQQITTPGATHRSRHYSSVSAFRQYVRDECLGRLTEPELHLLTRLAPFELVDANALNVLNTPPSEHARICRRIVDAGLPCTLEQDGRAVRLHPLMRECLLQEFSELVPHDEQIRIAQSAALRWESLESPLDAARMLMSVSLYDEAVALARRNWLSIIKQNQVTETANLLARMPDSVRHSPDYLSLWSSLLSVKGENKRLLSEVGDRLSMQHFSEYPNQYAMLWTRYRWAWLLYQHEPAYELIRSEWQEVERQLGPLQRRSTSDAHLVLYMAAFAEHKGEAARSELDESNRLNDGESFDVSINLSTDTAALQHHLGQSAAAQAQLQHDFAECERRNALTVTPLILANLTEILLATGHLSEALASADRAEAYIRVHGLSAGSTQLYLARASGHALWLKGDLQGGRKRLTHSLRVAEGFSGLEASSIHALTDFLQSIPSGAAAWSKGPEPPFPRVGEGALIVRAHACLWALSGSQFDKAAQTLRELNDLAIQSESRPWQATASILAALLAARRNDTPAVDTHLRKGLDILAAIEWNWFPLACEPLLAFVIWQAVRLNLHVGLAERLLAGEVCFDHGVHVSQWMGSCELDAGQAAHLIEFATRNRVRGLRWSEILSESHVNDRSDQIREYERRHAGWELPGLRIEFLGSDSVYSMGRCVAFARTKSKLAFQALLLAYPRALHEEQLIELLWPESEPRRGRHALQVCMNDIRTTLDPAYQPRGRSYVSYQDECYRLELPATSWVDFLEFQTAMERAGPFSASTGGSADEINRLSEALEHYKGDLLPTNPYAEFAMAPRERLRAMYLKGCIGLASALLARHQSEPACHYLYRGLELDPLWAEGVEMLMRAHAAAGRVYRAVRVYREYESRLGRDLDIRPDDSLRSLLAEILADPSL